MEQMLRAGRPSVGWGRSRNPAVYTQVWLGVVVEDGRKAEARLLRVVRPAGSIYTYFGQ